ncbi:hypothetical protein D3C72_2098980 [compost metagenome]
MRAVGANRLVRTPERADQRGLGAAGCKHGLGIHQKHQRGKPENIRQQDALVFFRSGGLADADHEVQAMVEFLIGQLDL